MGNSYPHFFVGYITNLKVWKPKSKLLLDCKLYHIKNKRYLITHTQPNSLQIVLFTFRKRLGCSWLDAIYFQYKFVSFCSALWDSNLQQIQKMRLPQISWLLLHNLAQLARTDTLAHLFTYIFFSGECGISKILYLNFKRVNKNYQLL